MSSLYLPYIVQGLVRDNTRRLALIRQTTPTLVLSPRESVSNFYLVDLDMSQRSLGRIDVTVDRDLNLVFPNVFGPFENGGTVVVTGPADSEREEVQCG